MDPLESSIQSCEHSADSSDLFFVSPIGIAVEIPEIASEQQLVVHLARGA